MIGLEIHLPEDRTLFGEFRKDAVRIENQWKVEHSTKINSKHSMGITNFSGSYFHNFLFVCSSYHKCLYNLIKIIDAVLNR